MAERTAYHWRKLEDERVECTLCPHRCKVKPGATGICRVRANREGQLLTLNYW
jgi:pyruvate formate lyase activating enzyme